MEFLNTNEVSVNLIYLDAAKNFKEISKNAKPNQKTYWKEVAKCYFSGKQFLIARKYFLKLNSWNEAGESIIQFIAHNPENKEERKLYYEAINLFEKTNNISKILYCLECLKEFKQILLKLFEWKKNIIDYDQQLKKYLVLLFKKITLPILEGKIYFLFILIKFSRL